MNGDRRRGVCDRNDITVTVIVEVNNGDVECLLRRFVINRRVEAARTIAVDGDKALDRSSRGNRGNNIRKTVTIDETGRNLFWHRNEVGVGKQDYFGRAKGTVSIISPDRYGSVVERTGAV